MYVSNVCVCSIRRIGTNYINRVKYVLFYSYKHLDDFERIINYLCLIFTKFEKHKIEVHKAVQDIAYMEVRNSFCEHINKL